MNTNGLICAFGFAVLSLLSRMAFGWLIRLSYKTAGKTLREVEKHYDEVKRQVIPYEKEFIWLARVSPRPILTKALYISYYVLCSLGLVGIVLSVINLFVPQFDLFLGKFAFALLALCIVSAVFGATVNNIIENKNK